MKNPLKLVFYGHTHLLTQVEVNRMLRPHTEYDIVQLHLMYMTWEPKSMYEIFTHHYNT